MGGAPEGPGRGQDGDLGTVGRKATQERLSWVYESFGDCFGRTEHPRVIPDNTTEIGARVKFRVGWVRNKRVWIGSGFLSVWVGETGPSEHQGHGQMGGKAWARHPVKYVGFRRFWDSLVHDAVSRKQRQSFQLKIVFREKTLPYLVCF